MARSEAELTRAVWEAFTAHDGTAGLGLLAERFWTADVVYIEDPAIPGAATFRGRDRVVARFAEYGESLGEHTEIEVEDVRALGAAVVSIIVFRGRSAGIGAPWEHRWGYVTRMCDGRIAEWRAYHDPDAAMAAAEAGVDLGRP